MDSVRRIIGIFQPPPDAVHTGVIRCGNRRRILKPFKQPGNKKSTVPDVDLGIKQIRPNIMILFRRLLFRLTMRAG